MSDWLKKYQDADERLYNCTLPIKGLIKAFYRTGNDVLGGELSELYTEIELCRKQMASAVTQSINERYQHAQETSATILKTALVGAKITS